MKMTIEISKEDIKKYKENYLKYCTPADDITLEEAINGILENIYDDAYKYIFSADILLTK